MFICQIPPLFLLSEKKFMTCGLFTSCSIALLGFLPIVKNSPLLPPIEVWAIGCRSCKMANFGSRRYILQPIVQLSSWVSNNWRWDEGYGFSIIFIMDNNMLNCFIQVCFVLLQLKWGANYFPRMQTPVWSCPKCLRKLSHIVGSIVDFPTFILFGHLEHDFYVSSRTCILTSLF